MFDIPDDDSRNKLAARLALKTGLSEDQARTFLEALTELTKESELDHYLAANFPTRQVPGPVGEYGMSPSPVPGHVISIPLIEQEDGTMVVDKSGYSVLVPWLKRKKTQPPSPASPALPGDPPAEPPKPVRPPGPKPGAYPGPSVFIKVNEWLGPDLELGASALGRLRKVASKTKVASLSNDLGSFGDLSKLNEK